MSISNRSSAEAAATDQAAATSSSGRNAPRPATSLTPERRRFTLSGPSRPLDHRTEAARRDLADISVAGRWFAPHYAVPERRSASRNTDLKLAASDVSDTIGSLEQGGSFDVLEVSGGWAWGSCAGTRLVGYVRSDALRP